MVEILNGFLKEAPDIIGKVQSPLGLASLIVLVLGIVGVFLFRNVAGNLRLAAFAMITGGLLGLFIFASNPTKPDGTSGDAERKAAADAKAEADRNTCARYAASAVADYKRMMEIPQCQDWTIIFFYYRWQSSYQEYFDWCNNKLVSSRLANWESAQRDAHLRQCGAR